MDVLVITSTFPRSATDAQVPWLAQLVLLLKKEKMKVAVYAPAYKGLSDHAYFGIPVFRFRYGPKSTEILTHEEGAVFKLREKPELYSMVFFYLIFGLFGLFRLAMKYRFDVVHVHWPFPNGIFGIVAKWIFGAKLILSFHGAEFTLMRRIPLGMALLRLILKNADHVVANSAFTKQMIEEIEPTKIHIIPFASGLSTQSNKSVEKSKRKILRLLFVGRLIERKGVSYFVDAVSQLVGRGIPVNVDIVGNGPLYDQIMNQIKRLGLLEHIRLHGEVDTHKLTGFYKQCDVFVLPSIIDHWGDTEGLGVVLVEAMSFGKPVVASRVGGIPDAVRNGNNGLLTPQKDSKALADAIEKLFRNPHLVKTLGENGLSLVRKNYNWKSIIQKTMKLYQLKGS